MSRYRQLSIEERCSIARLHEDGQSIRQIAAALDRQPSTIAREVKRNSGAKVGYQPAYAQAQANARRWTGTRLERDDALREAVLDRLAQGWSPEQVAGRLARDVGHKRSEEHTSELQSIMSISYAGFCLKKNKQDKTRNTIAAE